MTATTPPLRLGARTSPLARAQVELVAGWLAERGVASTFVGVTTTGDVDPRQLTEIGGTGVFAGAVREALRRGEIDVAVHSLKDLPTAPEPDLAVIAVPGREDTRDVIIGARLDDLRGHVRVGTGAPRRAVQLLDWAERERAAGRDLELEVVPIRGNVETRIRRAAQGDVDAVVLAGAGLKRLGLLIGEPSDAGTERTDTVVSNLQAQILDHDVMLPAPGQGALALEVHAQFTGAYADAVGTLDDPVARAEILVERAFLAGLEAGCTAPVGARAAVKSVRGTSLDLTIASVIGRTYSSNLSEPSKSGSIPTTAGLLRWKAQSLTSDPEEFGHREALAVLAQLSDPEGPGR